jgi:hypothetical protein
LEGIVKNEKERAKSEDTPLILRLKMNNVSAFGLHQVAATATFDATPGDNGNKTKLWWYGGGTTIPVLQQTNTPISAHWICPEGI